MVCAKGCRNEVTIVDEVEIWTHTIMAEDLSLAQGKEKESRTRQVWGDGR